jgi:isopenicillin-N epimerase
VLPLQHGGGREGGSAVAWGGRRPGARAPTHKMFSRAAAQWPRLRRFYATGAPTGYKGFGSFHGENVEEMMARAAAGDGSWTAPSLPDNVAAAITAGIQRQGKDAGYGARLRDSDFLLAREWTYLNHGAFGAACRTAHDAAAAWRVHAEKQPLSFIDRQLFAHVIETMRELGDLIGASPLNLAMLPNATSALNVAISAACRAADVGDGDEILLLDVGYGSVQKMATREARQRGATLVTVPLIPELSTTADADEIVSRVTSCLTPRTRLAIFDQITSNTAMRIPVARLTSLCRSQGILSVVDAAHSIASVPSVDVPALGGDFACANLHKWLCGVRGSAILHVRADVHGAVEPLIVSHGYGAGGLASDFVWQGAGDYAPWLSTTACLRWWESVGGIDAAARRNNDLLRHAAKALCDSWSSATLIDVESDACSPTMALVQLPLAEWRGPFTPAAGKGVQDYLHSERIECPVKTVNGRLYVRISAAVYNELEDYEHLGQVVRDADWSAVLA